MHSFIFISALQYTHTADILFLYHLWIRVSNKITRQTNHSHSPVTFFINLASILSPPLQVPAAESSIHTKNPFHQQSTNQSSKTIFDFSHNNTLNKSSPTFDEVSGLQKL